MDCKWLTVSEVMRLLKACGQDGVDMKVVSLLDFTSSMVSADSLVGKTAMQGEAGLSPAPGVCLALRLLPVLVI